MPLSNFHHDTRLPGSATLELEDDEELDEEEEWLEEEEEEWLDEEELEWLELEAELLELDEE